MIKGTLKASTIAIGKVSYDTLREVPRLEVSAAIVNPDSGQTHGWLDNRSIVWSKETGRAIEALLECLEADLARQHFKEGTQNTSGTRVTDDAGGIGELLGVIEDGAPQA